MYMLAYIYAHPKDISAKRESAPRAAPLCAAASASAVAAARWSGEVTIRSRGTWVEGGGEGEDEGEDGGEGERERGGVGPRGRFVVRVDGEGEGGGDGKGGDKGETVGRVTAQALVWARPNGDGHRVEGGLARASRECGYAPGRGKRRAPPPAAAPLG